jgi:hypothetical protein
MELYLLWHVSHAMREGTPRHRDEDDEVLIEEDLGDDVKLLGCYSRREIAEARIVRARELPGFRDEPDCFIIDPSVLDRDEWSTGYVTVSDTDLT